ncbi:MAG: preprotein translocase subunit SecA [Planctomycetota bacterium]
MAGKNQGIPIVGPLLNRIIGTRNERFVKRYTSRVERINELEVAIRPLTDAQLIEKTAEFKRRLAEGEDEDAVMVEALAVAREAMDRNVGIRSIFNPEHGFDPSVLNGSVREAYDRVKAEIDAAEPRAAEGDLLGGTDPIPAWVWTDIPNELYEAVRELHPESKPPFRARPFDVQLIGSMVLSQGKISEMKTGEGKTIVAPLAAYWASLRGLKVHVVTVNDYLVQRDRDWTFPFFRGVGLTVGAIHPQHMQPEPLKRQMYLCDVVYGTTSEFGFDYLRDNMKRSVGQQVQRRRDYAIVDEVDSVLIDEARTPLIISGQAHEQQPRYDLADSLAKHLREKQEPWQAQEDKVQALMEKIKGLEGDIRQARDKSSVPEMQKQLAEAKKQLPSLEHDRDQHVQYYEKVADRKQVHLTHEGIAEAQRVAGIGSFYVGENMDVPHLLEQSLRARVVYEKDKDYVIMNVPDPQTGRTEPSVVIVDQFTGRAMIGRQWSDGLHQAIECKEQVPIKQETQTVASVTIQNFFKTYKQLAGMTGTADTEAQEFHDIYGLDVVSIPTNKPVVRRDFDDLMFLRAKDKWEAIVDEIKAFHEVGRPVLVGTTSVEMSEMLSQLLTRKHGIKHEVLNAKQHEREANIVESAGDMGAVMIATNMAGRGTDIKLRPVSREAQLDHWLRRSIAGKGLTVEADEASLRENVYRKIASAELGIKKRDAETMDFAELEFQLLSHWAEQTTWLTPKQIASCDAEELREALDENGRCLLHRIRWFSTLEEMGGLHVIGTERHESRRIDNQLRGRSGRQGDRGSSRFFVSLEDDLMKMFAGQTTMNVLSRLGMKEGDAIEHPILSKSVERAQRKVEERNFQIRKNILEYDEVMEHQRQGFYGLRQRVLEMRDVKPLILEYIDGCIDEACAEYLSPAYPAECAVEHVREALDTEIPVERLKGRDADEMDKRIREDAKAEARSMIDVTLGEYMSAEDAEVVVDFDSAGLVSWAKTRFGVDIDAAELAEGSAATRHAVQDRLVEAAEAKIDEADLSRLDVFLAPEYGIEQLIAWAKRMFDVEVTVEEVKSSLDETTPPPESFMRDRVRERYHRKEVDYPVDFALQMTMAGMRQSPQEALGSLLDWSKRRYGVELDPDESRRGGPAVMRQKLTDAAEAWWADDALGKLQARVSATSSVDELNAVLEPEFGSNAPDWLEWLDEAEFQAAARGLVETRLRGEMLQLETTIMLDTLDQSWKDHLYAMDQLRDGINYQAFAQQDPRIAFKKQGSKQYTEMMDDSRSRVAEYIFKMRLSPMPPQGGAQPGARPAPAGAAAGVVAGQGAPGGGPVTPVGSTIVGAGLPGPLTPKNPAGGGQPPAGGAG